MLGGEAHAHPRASERGFLARARPPALLASAHGPVPALRGEAAGAPSRIVQDRWLSGRQGPNSLGPPPMPPPALTPGRVCSPAQWEAQGCPTGCPRPVEPCSSSGLGLASAPGAADPRARELQLAQTSGCLRGPRDPAGW